METWKFPLAVMDRQAVSMPRDAVFLDVQSQGGRLTVWALVDPEAPRVEVTFYVTGTGNPHPREAIHYRGSVQMPPFVWHVWTPTS